MKIKLKKENHFIQLIVFNFLSAEQINQDRKMNRGKQIICACIPNSKKISSIDFELILIDIDLVLNDKGKQIIF